MSGSRETGNPRSKGGNRASGGQQNPGKTEGSHYPEAAAGSPHPGALCQPLFHIWRKVKVNQEFINNLKYIVEHSITAKRKSKTEGEDTNPTKQIIYYIKKCTFNKLNRMAF